MAYESFEHKIERAFKAYLQNNSVSVPIHTSFFDAQIETPYILVVCEQSEAEILGCKMVPNGNWNAIVSVKLISHYETLSGDAHIGLEEQYRGLLFDDALAESLAGQGYTDVYTAYCGKYTKGIDQDLYRVSDQQVVVYGGYYQSQSEDYTSSSSSDSESSQSLSSSSSSESYDD